jgi:hypothetical protein
MATISPIKLELPLLGGNQYKAVVKYKVTFVPIEVEGEARYRHKVKLIGDDTNTGDFLEDQEDDNLRTLLNEVITAQSTPLTVNLHQGPFPISNLNEDPELFAKDTVRALVTLTPVSARDPWAPKKRESKAVEQQF